MKRICIKGDPESKTTTYEAYATGDSNTLTAADIDKYVEVDETGKLKYKEGKVLYKKAGTPGTAVGQQENIRQSCIRRQDQRIQRPQK